MARYGDGEVLAIVRNFFPIKDESWVPIQANTLNDIIAIAAGGSHSVALKKRRDCLDMGVQHRRSIGRREI